MIFPHLPHPTFFPALRAYARYLTRRPLSHQERQNLAASRGHAAVYSASLGCHPHF